MCWPERNAVVGRELTKKFEEFVRALWRVDEGTSRGRGEVVILIEGQHTPAASTEDLIESHLTRLLTWEKNHLTQRSMWQRTRLLQRTGLSSRSSTEGQNSLTGATVSLTSTLA